MDTSQSLLDAQLTLHAPDAQRYPLQEVPGVVVVQTPDPLHVPGSTLRWSVEQLLQVSPAWVWHPDPLAAQNALFPQAASVQEVAQQTMFPAPSPMHVPLAHSPGPAQGWPSTFRQAVPLQV